MLNFFSGTQQETKHDDSFKGRNQVSTYNQENRYDKIWTVGHHCYVCVVHSFACSFIPGNAYLLWDRHLEYNSDEIRCSHPQMLNKTHDCSEGNKEVFGGAGEARVWRGV